MPQPFFRLMDVNGDGTGEKNAIGDYSSVQTDFKFVVPADFPTKVFAHVLNVHLSDNTNFSADKYGNLAGALTNGIQFLVEDANGNVFRDLTDGEPVKTNAHFGKFSFDLELDNFGSGDDFLRVRWDFALAGAPIQMFPGWSFIARLNDSFVGMIFNCFNLQGVYK